MSGALDRCALALPLSLLAMSAMLGGCQRAPARELAGAAERIVDQVYFERQLDAWNDEPGPLKFDVHADAIYVQTSGGLQVIRRGDAAHSTVVLGTHTQLITTPKRDDLLVWTERIEHLNEGVVDRFDERVIAARTDDVGEPWTLFDYRVEDAVSAPVVVGDQVALLTKQGIVHTSLDGGAVSVLSLGALEPQSLPLAYHHIQTLSAQPSHLVWIASEGEHSFVVSTDTRFDAPVIEYEAHEATTWLLVAAKLGDGLVIVSLERFAGSEAPDEERLPTLIVQRYHPATGAVELWRRPFNHERLILMSDDAQSWLLFDRELWRITPEGHAPVQPEPQLQLFMDGAAGGLHEIALDDGLLSWTTKEGRLLRHHITTSVLQPLLANDLSRMNDDDVWEDLVPSFENHDGWTVLDQAQPRVHLDQLIVGVGIERDSISQIMRGHLDEVRACYEEGLGSEPELGGVIELELVIGADGMVHKTRDLRGDQFVDQGVRRCVAAAVRRWQFPKPVGTQQVEVNCAIALSPADTPRPGLGSAPR